MCVWQWHTFFLFWKDTNEGKYMHKYWKNSDGIRVKLRIYWSMFCTPKDDSWPLTDAARNKYSKLHFTPTPTPTRTVLHPKMYTDAGIWVSFSFTFKLPVKEMDFRLLIHIQFIEMNLHICLLMVLKSAFNLKLGCEREQKKARAEQNNLCTLFFIFSTQKSDLIRQ